MGGYTAFQWSPPAPFDYASVAAYDSDTGHYVVGNLVKKQHLSTGLYVVYSCILANGHASAKDPESEPTYWLPVTVLPMMFVCRKGNWSYESYNATSLTATFEQVFDIA
jgi:phage-related protein